MGKATEEFALPLLGKKKNIKREHLFDYYGQERMGLNKKTINSEIKNLLKQKNQLEQLIDLSFLSKDMKKNYLKLMQSRYERLGKS